MTQTEQAGIAEYIRDQFTEALTDAADVRVRWISQEHSGPYVPGGTYREMLGEVVIVDNRVAVDLASLEGVSDIPRAITAPYSGCSNGQDFDVTLQFDLHHVTAPFGVHSEGLAIYSVTEV